MTLTAKEQIAIKVLGVRVDGVSLEETLARCDRSLCEKQATHIVTVNPEIILLAQEEESYFMALRKADLTVADGFGLILAGLVTGRTFKRVTGVDLTAALLDQAARSGRRSLVIIRKDGLTSADTVRAWLERTRPGQKIAVLESPQTPDNDFFRQVGEQAPDYCFVGLGAPYQERFLVRCRNEGILTGVGIGVGGTFDLLTGTVKRAPAIFRRSGMEWLYRIAASPSGTKLVRSRRIMRAVAVFPWRFLMWRFVDPFRYRKSVACMLYRRTGAERIDVLVVERSDEPGHWQIPQGGRDGETVTASGYRELVEETGTDRFDYRAHTGTIHRYLYRSDRRMGAGYGGYKGQAQALYIAEFNGRDADIVLKEFDHRAWRWVPLQDLIASVHVYRQKGAKKFVEAFIKVIER